MQNKSQKKQNGSTLIGLMIAVVILGVTLTASTAFLTRNTRLSSVTENEIIASFLAEEGIELVKNIRDSADSYCLSQTPPIPPTGFNQINKSKPNKPDAYTIDNSIQTFTNTLDIDSGAYTFDDTRAGLCLNTVGTGKLYQISGCSITSTSRKFIRKIQLLKTDSDQGIEYDCQALGTTPGVLAVSTVYWSESWENNWPKDPSGGGADAYKDDSLWDEGDTTLHKRQVKTCLYNWRPD